MMIGMPEKTNSVSHTVTVGIAQPMRLAPYWVPQVYREQMKELVNMLEDGVIQESTNI